MPSSNKDFFLKFFLILYPLIRIRISGILFNLLRISPLKKYERSM